MTDIARWLGEHGLEKYADAFRAAEIDLEALRHLTEDDLKEMGLPIGPRRKALAGIAALADTWSAGAAGSTGDSAPRGEPDRRQLTVVFADLVGSTAMAQAMDPEELRGVIRGYQDMAAGAIARFEGHVAKFMGDGVLAYFGWPCAHEDQAERAVRAGLALIAGLTSAGRNLAVRVGIATGVVVVGDVVGQGGAREEAAVGETLNLAARLQQIAEPGAVVICAATRALLGETFELDPRGPQALKGIGAPVEAWNVRRERRVETRFEAARGRRLGRLVGRDQELALALARWDLAKAGEGQVVLFRAEPGIGKSRLVAELRARLESQTVATLSYQGSPHHGSSALYPVIQHLVRAADLETDDQAETKLQKLDVLVARSRIDPVRAVPLLASLLSIPSPGTAMLAALSPQQRKEETQAVLLDLLAGLAGTGAVVLVVEDLQWFDPTSRELLDALVPRIEALPVLLLGTFRTEMAIPWEAHGHATLITLNRLGRRQVEAQIAAIAEARDLPGDVVEQIVAKSDGVPLFVEELTKTALELGSAATIRSGRESDGKPPLLSVPNSLRASLLARLDRLPEAREIAQIGAVLGREFDFDLLVAVAAQGETRIAGALEDLHRAELVFPRGTAPRTRWAYKHALIQEAAYETLLKASRVALHHSVAEAITSTFPALADAEPETVARHYESGGDPGRAATFWHRAGSRALARFAGVEAVQHLARAIELYPARTPDDVRLEVEVAMGEALAAAGHLSEAVSMIGPTIEKARAAGNAVAFARAAIALCQSEVNSSRAQPDTVALVAEAIGMTGTGDGALRLRLMNMHGLGLTMIGEFERAQSGVNDAVALARQLGDRAGLSQALELRFLAPIGLTREQIDEYRASGDDLVEATRAAGHPMSEVRVIMQQIFWSAQFGDIQRLRALRRVLDDLSSRARIEYQKAVDNQIRAMEAILVGDLAAGERFATAALEIGERKGIVSAAGAYGIQMFTIRREQGRLAEVAGVFKRFIDEAPDGSAWEPGFALLASDLGYDAPARRILARFAAEGFALPVDAMRSTTLAYLAEVAVQSRDREAAKSIFRLLLPYQHMTVTVGMSVVCCGAASRFLARLADLLEDRATAEAQFERAMAIDARMDAHLWLAHSQADYAAALRRWGRASDLARADALADAAMATAQRLDLAFLRHKLEAPRR